MKNDYGWNLDTNELYHHGVIGQKWGIKNGPPYPLDSSISTGSSLKNVTNGKHKGSTLPTPGSDRSKRKKNAIGILALPIGLGASVALAYFAGIISPTLMLTSVGVGLSSLSTLVKGDLKENAAKKKAKQFKKERESNPVDEKTGFHLKTSDLSQEEDQERVNPEYKNWDENTKNNCVMCSVTYDMRRRGYDVTAKTSLKGVNSKEVTESVYKNAKTNYIDNRKITNYNMIRVTSEQSKLMLNKLGFELKNQPNGSRGMVSVGWNNTMSGHCLNYEVDNDEVYIVDAQSNERYTIDKFPAEVNEVSYCRTDNLKINADKMKEYMI